MCLFSISNMKSSRFDVYKSFKEHNVFEQLQLFAILISIFLIIVNSIE